MPSPLLRNSPIQYEPKLTNRFFLEFPQELGIEVWEVLTSGRPQITIEGTELPYFNTRFTVRTRYYFEDISITLMDFIAPSTSQQIMEWVRLHAEPFTGRMGYAAGYKKDLFLKQADPAGNEIEKWALYQTSITSATFGEENSYDSGDAQKVTIDIAMDYAELLY